MSLLITKQHMQTKKQIFFFLCVCVCEALLASRSNWLPHWKPEFKKIKQEVKLQTKSYHWRHWQLMRGRSWWRHRHRSRHWRWNWRRHTMWGHLRWRARMHDGFLVISSKVMDANNINQEKNKGHITFVLSSTKRFQK